MRQNVVEHVRRQRSMVLLLRGRLPPRRIRRRLPKQNQPDAIRMAYFAAILVLLERAKSLVDRRVKTKLEDLVARARILRGDERKDAGGDDVRKLMDEVATEWSDVIDSARIEQLVAEFGDRTSAFQGRQLSNQLQSAVGVEVPTPDTGVGQRLNDFVADNVSLIESILDRYFDQVEQRIIGGIRDGSRWEEIAQELEDRFDVSRSSARLVARDQVGRLYAELNELRQTNLGVTEYVWRCVLDNRVRPEHEDRNGKTFSWSDPPEDGSPGEAIQCRCWAEPDLSGVLEDL